MTARRLLIEADGGSRGNPGIAGYGALVRDAASGEVLAERAAPLGTASNNVAEYTGLVVGLGEAELIDASAAIEVRMDSKLVVEQMSGRWKIKHEDMKRLAAQAREVAARIREAGGVVVYRWVPREHNKAADALSNDGMDGKSVTRRPWQEHDPRSGADSASADGDLRHQSDGAQHRTTRRTSGRADHSAEPAASADDQEPATSDGATDERLEALACAPQPERTDRLPARAARSGAGAPCIASATRVVLVRHGVTQANRDGRLSGRGGADLDLDGEGQQQARRVAAALHAFLGDAHTASGSTPLRVLTSSLVRAHRTGQLVAARFGVSCQTDSDWDEQDYGDYEGRTIAELVAADAEALTRLRADPEAVRPGGESHHDLARRVVAAFERQVEAGGTAVVATHRQAILAVLGHVLGADLEHVWRFAIGPASMTSIRVWSDGAMAIEFVNDTSHLR